MGRHTVGPRETGAEDEAEATAKLQVGTHPGNLLAAGGLVWGGKGVVPCLAPEAP